MAVSKTPLSDNELAAYRGYFWKQDTSGDGRLNLPEFEKMMHSMGMNLTRTEIRKAFKAADVDRSGEITFIEFANTFLNKGWCFTLFFISVISRFTLRSIASLS